MAIEKSPDNPQVRQMLANPVKSITCFHPRTPPDVLQYLKVQSRVYVYGNFLCRCVLGFWIMIMMDRSPFFSHQNYMNKKNVGGWLVLISFWFL